MQIPRHIRTGRPLAALTLAGTLLLVFVFANCAHSPDTELVGDRISPQTRTHTVEAKAAMVETLGQFAHNYDQAVCERAQQRAESERVRFAVSEAYLELMHAVEVSAAEAKASAQSENETAGDADEDESGDGITWVNVEPGADDPAAASGQLLWFCAELDDQKPCVRSAANAAARAFSQHVLEPADLEVKEIPQALDAFADEFQWGLGIMTEQPSLPEALGAIERGCKDGESPLSHYLDEDGGDVDGRQRLTEALMRGESDFCAALPSLYRKMAKQLRSELGSRQVTGRCGVQSWSPLPY